MTGGPEGRRQLAPIRPVRRVGVALALLLAGGCAAPAPSLLLITVDTLRADHLPTYGYTRATAPRLAALASGGVTFDKALAAVPETAPACASLLTGKWPAEIGVRGNGHPLAPGSSTLAEMLGSAGYETAAFVSGFPLIRRLSGLDRGFSLYDDTLPDPRGPVPNVQRGAARTTEAVLAWLRRLHGSRPFFLWVHYYDVHGDYAPGAPYDTLFGTGGSGPFLPLAEIPGYQRHDAQTDASAYVARYDGEIRRVDDQIGRLLDAMGRAGRLANTLVVATADHGESLTEHGYYFDHGNEIYLPSLRIPLILSGPGVPTDGRHVAAVVQSPDLLPTILELLGRTVPAPVSGVSALPALRGGTPAPRESWFEARFETYRALTPGADVGPKVAARDDRFTTLLRLGSGRLEIYDREADPAEIHDLAAGLPAGGPDAALRNTLERALRARSDAARDGLRRAPLVLTPATRTALEAFADRRP